MKKIQQILSREEGLFLVYLEDGKISKIQKKLVAQAKINLHLEILGKRLDNYHELESIMQTIGLHDKLEINLLPLNDLIEGQNYQIQLTSLEANLLDSCPQDNLIYKASRNFLEFFKIRANLDISFEKKIPMAAGLAGGSADAAACLRGLFQLFNYFYFQDFGKDFLDSSRQDPLNIDELFLLAGKLGADVPFCLQQASALCKGIGEELYPLPGQINLPLILYTSPLTIYTPEAFGFLAAQAYEKKEEDIDALLAAYKGQLASNPNNYNQFFRNDFSFYVFQKYPELKEVMAAFDATGSVFTRVTGSGPSLFAVYPNFQVRDQALEHLNALNLKELGGQFLPSFTSYSR